MKLIIAGSRTWAPSTEFISKEMVLAGYSFVSEVVSGRAKGADAAGEKWALKADVPVIPYPADWTKHGTYAGILRNGEMADYADAALVFWRDRSSGSANMIAEMALRRKPVWVVEWKRGKGAG